MDARTALQTLLDQVDYTRGACRVTEMVGAVLPKVVIENARASLELDPIPTAEEIEALLMKTGDWAKIENGCARLDGEFTADDLDLISRRLRCTEAKKPGR